LTETCRADVWLWRARFFKTRSSAAKAIASGQVRLSALGQSRVLAKPSAAIHPEDGLTIALPSGGEGRVLKTVRIRALGARRGPASEARLLYSDVE
jgi:ribosome-associated heat shock protein Hsp15